MLFFVTYFVLPHHLFFSLVLFHFFSLFFSVRLCCIVLYDVLCDVLSSGFLKLGGIMNDQSGVVWCGVEKGKEGKGRKEGRGKGKEGRMEERR